MESSPTQFSEHVISIRMHTVPNYKCLLKLSDQAPPADHMTLLMHAIDFVKEQVGLAQTSEVDLFFDEDNPTTLDEVLNTKMEELLIKKKGELNPFLENIDTTLSDTDQIYLNKKS